MAHPHLSAEEIACQNTRIRQMRAEGMKNRAIGAIFGVFGDAIAKRVAVMRRNGHIIPDGPTGPKPQPIIADDQLPKVIQALRRTRSRAIVGEMFGVSDRTITTAIRRAEEAGLMSAVTSAPVVAAPPCPRPWTPGSRRYAIIRLRDGIYPEFVAEEVNAQFPHVRVSPADVCGLPKGAR